MTNWISIAIILSFEWNSFVKLINTLIPILLLFLVYIGFNSIRFIMPFSLATTWEWLQSNGWQAFNQTISENLEVAQKLSYDKMDLSTFYGSEFQPYVVSFDDMKAKHIFDSNMPLVDVRRVEVFPKLDSGKNTM